MNETVEIPKRDKRHFLPEDFKVESWEKLKPYFDKLLEQEINSEEELKAWFKNRSELESVISEDMAWRYIKMTCNTADESLTEAFEYFVREIQPHIAPVEDALNKKALAVSALNDLKKEKGWDIMIREMEKDVEIFREKNIPLQTELSSLSQKYGSISGAMSVEIEGKEYTLQQAAVKLQSTDRALREEVYKKIQNRRLEDKEKLDDLFNQLIKLRDEVAKNADFSNYRDYMFKAMGRFDYTPQDCFDFHDAIASEVAPLLNNFARERKEDMKLDALRPWDKAVDPLGRKPLQPFDDADQLTKKAINVFRKVDPFLGNCLEIMDKMGHLDLDSRKGKAPGGYNYPLAEIGVPFIFMNATSTLRDMVTLMHEGGHAVHSFLMRDLEINDFKSTPSEVAELASMSMELISMDYWDEFFEDEEELRRAKKEHLEQVMETLPWVATIDKFQHWLYENPEHNVKARDDQWVKTFEIFSDEITDWSDLEHFKRNMWQKQLHLYEVPFYYIEYGMAQLGAIAVWKNYKEDRAKGLEGYLNALKLGYTKSIPKVYEAANIRFDFSQDYIKELIQFVKGEWAKL